MSALPTVDPTGGALSRTATNRFNEMSSEDFIRIIFTELSNQDPFSPNDSAALLDQLNSIRSIESDIQLTEKLESLVFENQLASASNLIGKEVTGLALGNLRVSGTAVSARREGSDVFIELDNGFTIPFENIENIQQPSTTSPQTTL